MAEILLGEIAEKENTVVEKDSAKKRLENYLATHHIKIARTVEDLLGPETEQTQEEIQAEVDDFLRLREEWRKEDVKRNFE